MIETLLIRNFQSHKRTELKFDKGVNCIIGPTDSGKSSIIRALQWLFWNTPSGDEFCSTWSDKDTVVKIWGWQHWDNAENDHFERGIDKKGGYYYHHGGIMMRAFGQSVPEEAKKYFNMSEINLQEQSDNPFLLNESPGKVAAFFNNVAGLSKIDSSNQYIQAQIRTTSSQLAHNIKFLKEKKKELKTYAFLKKATNELVLLERKDKIKTKRIQSIKSLKSLVNDIETIQANLDETNVLIKAEKNVDHVLQQIKIKEKKSEQIIFLSSIILKIKERNKKILMWEKTIAVEGKVNTVLQKISTCQALSTRYSQFKNIVYTLQQVKTKSLKINGNLKQMEEQWLEEFPNVCPLCGSEKKYHKH